MKNTIVLPHSKRVINTEHLAASASANVPGYKWEDVMGKFLCFTYRSHSKKVIDDTATSYRIKLWFVGGVAVEFGGHLYIPYEDEAKRDADFRYLMQFATNE